MLAHVTGVHATDKDEYQPMNINFGLMPPPPLRDDNGRKIKGRDRKAYAAARALADLAHWI
jgi:methylenetetrahydrofolate--tRNA-(uracil-5-)-methyltransferase